MVSRVSTLQVRLVLPSLRASSHRLSDLYDFEGQQLMLRALFFRDQLNQCVVLISQMKLVRGSSFKLGTLA